MRDAREWAVELTGAEPSELGSLPAFIRRIQSDASRSAARSERERCAALCDRLRNNYNVESGRWERKAVDSCASHIRQLPDDPA